MKTLVALIGVVLFLSAFGHAQGTCPSGLPVTGTHCYFIAGSGSDSNNGTSESTPWLHAPGMPNCTSSCAGVTPSAGQGFIFRGGDTWHRSASTSDSNDVPIGGQWTTSHSGTSGNCSFPVTTSSCIYYGVDTTWYNSSVCSGSFCRPKLNLDNPLWANSTHQDSTHIGWITACTFEDHAITGWDLTASYVIIDNWEFLGKCWTSLPTYNVDSEFGADTAANGVAGNGTVLEHSYFHGWSMSYSGGQGSVFDKAPMIGGTGELWILSYNVFDGGDAGPPCNASGNCSGDVSNPAGTQGIQNWDHNVFRQVANTTNGTADVRTVHDNLFEHIYDSFDTTTHSDVFFTYGNQAPSGTVFSFYNNMLRNVSAGQTYAIDAPSAGTLNFFNNVMYGIGNAGNCIQFQNTDTNNATYNIANNTIVTPCTVNFGYNNNIVFARNVANFQNMHLVGFSSPLTNLYTLTGGGTNTFLTVNDNGDEIFQTTSSATSQGYTMSNNYQPTSTGGATYHAGGNLSSSCSSYSSDSALCNGSTGGVTNTAGSGNIPIAYITSPAARGSTWDTGAYQFSTTANFTCTPATIPANHSNNIAVACAGVGTSWTNSTVFSLSGVSGATLASKTFNSSTSYTLHITTGSGTGTLTITDTTDSISTALTVATATLSISSTSAETGTTPSLAFTGTNTLWSSETASTLFSLSGSGCSGDSLSTPAITSNTAAAATLTVGTGACVITVTDNSTTATASFTAVGPPTCTPGTGTYSATQTPACTNPNSGTTIQCYTTNGSTPATNGSGTGCITGSTLASGGTVSITTNKTLKIIAGVAGATDSAINSYTYTLQGAAPTFSPVGGYPPQTVTISQAQSLAICYTLDGSTPTSNGSGACSHGTLYTGMISVVTVETISAIGMASGWTDSVVGTATYSAGSTVGTGTGTGNFIIENSPTTQFPPTTGPDNYYCSASNLPINGLSSVDDNAQGPQTCMNTALANTPAPNGFYQHGGVNYTATGCSDLNNIMNGTGGFAQITPGTTLQILPGNYAGCSIATSVAGTSSDWIIFESSAIANLPAEGTRITPCYKGVVWNSSTGMPSYPSDGGCLTNYVPSFATRAASNNPTLQLNAGAAYLRFIGLEFTRDALAFGFAAQPSATIPGIWSRSCNSTNCTTGVSVGDGTTQGGIVSTSQSLSVNTSGVNVNAGTSITVQAAPQNNLTSYFGNYSVASVTDDHDLTYTQTYAQATLGNGGVITSITRTTGCLVTGNYSFTGILASPSIGLHVFVAGVTDPSFNMSSGSVVLTSYSSTSSTTFSFGYTQAGGTCTASTSSGGELIDVDSPALSTCPTLANNDCNGVVAQEADLTTIVGGFASNVNNIIFDRVLLSGDGGAGVIHWAETDNMLQLGDTDHIALIDSYCEGGQSWKVIGASDEGHCVSGGVNNNVDTSAGTYKIVDNFMAASGQLTIIGGAGQGFGVTSVTVTSGTSASAILTGTSGFTGTVSTSGTSVTGTGFNCTNNKWGTSTWVNIASVNYLISSCNSNTSLTLATSAGTQSSVTMNVAAENIPWGASTQLFAGSTAFPGGPLVNGINGNQTVTCCTTTTNTNDTFTFPTAVTCTSCTDSNVGTMAVGGYTPSSLEYRRNDLFKPLTWHTLDPSYDGGGPLPTGGLARTEKNHFELKNATNVLVEGNVLTSSENTVDEVGAAFLITPKNQGGHAPGAQVQNAIYRYNRGSNINVWMGVSNALSDSGDPAFQGNTYSIHDNLFAEVGNTLLTCTWIYPAISNNVIPCYTSSPIQTAMVRSGGPGATSVTPNFILGSVHFVHDTVMCEVACNYTLVTGGSGTQQSGAYGMVWKDSIFINGISNVFSLGGSASGHLSCSGTPATCTWVSGTQFNCLTWGQGTTITITGATPPGQTILTCNGTSNTSTSLTLTVSVGTLTNVAYTVGTCFTPCTGSSNTCTCKINSCWNNPIFDYNIIYNNSATGQSYPGAHTQLYNSASPIDFTNYNTAIPAVSTNWGSQFALMSASPGHLAADDGTDIGANVTKVSGYTFNVDVFQ